MAREPRRLLLPLILLVCLLAGVKGNPQGCTYSSATKEYSCSARSWSLPLRYSQFTSPVQVLKLVDIDGELPSASPFTFTEFSSHSAASFDPTFDARLEVHCYTGGRIIMTAGTFADMGWVKDFRIYNCQILTLPNNVFKDLGDLNYMSIEGGSIADSVGFDAMTGVNVYRMETSPTPQGTFAMRNCKLLAEKLQVGFLFSLYNSSNIIIENCNLKSTSVDMLTNSKKLLKLSLANNPFNSLPSGTFDHSPALKELELTGIDWTCTCENMWVHNWIENNNISLTGGIVCASPADKMNTRGKEFYDNDCIGADPCGIALGIKVNSSFCLQVADLVLYILTLATLVLAIVGLSIAIHNRRQMPKPREPPASVSEREMSGSELTQLDEANKKGTKGPQKGNKGPQKDAKGPQKDTKGPQKKDVANKAKRQSVQF